MTDSVESTIAVLRDAVDKTWWVPSGTADMAALRRAALEVLADRLTPERRFLRLLEVGALGEAENLLAACGDSRRALGELPDADQRLAAAREHATQRTHATLDGLRCRSERLGRTWDEDVAALLVSMAEEDEALVQAELNEMSDAVFAAEEEVAAGLVAGGERLDDDHRAYLHDLIAEKQWDASRHLVEHGRVDFRSIDRPTTPALARLGVAPAAVLRSFARGQDLSRRSDGWREADQQLMDVVSRISEFGLASTLAEALRCEATVDGETTRLHSIFDGPRAATVAVADICLRNTGRADELSVTIDGYDTKGLISLERTLQVLLSPGDRSWQLLRVTADGWSVDEVLGLTRPSAPVIDRIEAVLDLMLRSPQLGLATAVAHRAGFNLDLAVPLLAAAVPQAGRDGRLTSEDLDAALLQPDVVSAWDGSMARFAEQHRDAYLLFAEAASNNYTIIDAEFLALVAEDAGVQSFDSAVRDLEAAGFALTDDDGDIVLHVGPLRMMPDAGRMSLVDSENGS
ncbi:MAG: hypothetical protein GY798_21060 [Hyphomicrobiales bacterium]|nr:hypothetical protein [Hyphomicrobiales bacterium]